MKLPIKAKIWKTGSGSAVITIPHYLMQKHLVIGEEYDFEVEVDE